MKLRYDPIVPETMLLIAQQAGASQIQAPRTHDELMSLMARRDDQKDQLKALQQRMSQLTAQLFEDGTNATASARKAATDKTMAQVEADLDRLNAVIAEGMSRNLLQDAATAPPAPADDRLTTSAADWGEGMMGALQYTAPMTLASVVLLGVLLYWRISRSVRSQFTKMLAMQQARLEEIQRSVDTVAVEMERVSENQRYVTKLVGAKERVP